ncbi:MAG: hypothetical protein ACPG4Z_07540 [Chitinophagales bacterium]
MYKLIRQFEDFLIYCIKYTCEGDLQVEANIALENNENIADDTVIGSTTSVWSKIDSWVRNFSFSFPQFQMDKRASYKVAFAFSVLGIFIFSTLLTLNNWNTNLIVEDVSVPVSTHYAAASPFIMDLGQKESDYVAPIVQTFDITADDFYYMNGVKIEIKSDDFLSYNY